MLADNRSHFGNDFYSICKTVNRKRFVYIISLKYIVDDQGSARIYLSDATAPISVATSNGAILADKAGCCCCK